MPVLEKWVGVGKILSYVLQYCLSLHSGSLRRTPDQKIERKHKGMTEFSKWVTRCWGSCRADDAVDGFAR